MFGRDTFSEGKFNFMTQFLSKCHAPYLVSTSQFVAQIGTDSAQKLSTQMFTCISFYFILKSQISG